MNTIRNPAEMHEFMRSLNKSKSRPPRTSQPKLIVEEDTQPKPSWWQINAMALVALISIKVIALTLLFGVSYLMR